MSHHKNDGDCQRCNEIFDRYPGFHQGLRNWFKQVQKNNPEAHISCAGRGKQDQEDLLRKKATRADWKESAHNWNCAIDIFEQSGDTKNIYEWPWFVRVIEPVLTLDLVWYGKPGSSFFELPHVEVRNWKALTTTSLVEQ